MIVLAMVLSSIVVLAGVVLYLLTGSTLFLIVAAIGIVTGVSGYVLSGGRMRSR